MECQTLFKKVFREAGIKVSAENIVRFSVYLEELIRWNRKINLTGLVLAEEMVVKLFVDSAFAAPFVREGAKVLDVGSGGGFPGMVLALMSPRTHFTLAESRQKKVAFLKRVRSITRANNVTIHGKRVEEKSREELGFYDVVISRAAGKTGEMVRLGRQFLEKGGKIILMKGKEEECPSYQGALRRVEYELPSGFGPRSLWVQTSVGEKENRRGIDFLNH